VVHSAVTGKSTFITGGELGEVAGFLEERVIAAELRLSNGTRTFYIRWGEWVQGLAIGSLGSLLLRRWRASS
jgi:apolipoprotein N-acyltransferase